MHACLLPDVLTANEKSAQRRRNHCTLPGGAKTFAPPQTPFPGRGTEWPKFNQLVMVTTFTDRPSLVRIDARNFELSWKQTHKHTHPHTDRTDYNTLCRS